MKRILFLLAALLASGVGAAFLLSAGPMARAAAPVSAPPFTVQELSPLLPGVPVDALDPRAFEVLARELAEEPCYCGCLHTIGACLREHKSCRHAPRMAALVARLAQAGLGREEVARMLTEYYASFDKSKRARLDLKDFGPPLGDPKAPITIVEFSDFTCPYCRQFRPELEKFVEEHRDRVKLYYKPFPIGSHERAFDFAEAAEWARDHGLFWKMHDLLMGGQPAASENEVVGYAEQLGADGADLRKALETQRNRARIMGSRAEGRAAGMYSTPTLFFDGRRFTLPDLSRGALEFTLGDEEEWRKNGRWEKD